MTRIWVLLLALLPIAGPGAAAEALPPGWEAAMEAGGQPMQVIAQPVALGGARLSGVALAGVWALDADRPEFGGFSGLLVRGGRLFAVSDNAWWLGAGLAAADGALELRGARMAPIRGLSGWRYDRTTGDAKSLAWDGARLAVAFEQDHRIMRLEANGRTGAALAPEAFDRMSPREGVEALASRPGGGLIAIAQERVGQGAPVFVFGADGAVAEALLPMSWLNDVTGADLGPDGRLYLVQQEHSALFGIDVQVMRYRLDPAGFPLPESAELLAEFGAGSGIANIEGIAVEALAGGALRLWLISDNNFRATRPTQIVALDVLE